MADIKHAIQAAATPQQIYPLVATAEGLGQWWATDITEGETIDLSFFSRATVYKLISFAMDAPRRVEWVCESGDEWGGTHLVFEMEPLKSGTMIRFKHAGWRAESAYFTSCNTTWGELMFRLKAVAEGKNPGPLFTREGWVA